METCLKCDAKPGTMKCGRCHVARYCSAACQRAHWPAHKHLCGKPSLFVSGEKPNYDDFAISVTDIGAGNFSRVMKARHKGTGQRFALKEMDKAKVRKLSARHKNITNEIMMEKVVLGKLKGGPNVVNLVHTFSDDRGVYFLYELITGGELWCKVMRHDVQVGCDLRVARFFLLQILDALEFIHSHGIVHRDLKPENIMLTPENTLKVVDFGTSKDLVDTKYNGPEFVGTPDYMSPEVVDSKPSTLASDLWALGCMVYQFAVGRTPFKAPSDYLALRRVQDFDLHFPPHMDAQARDLASKLLVRDAKERLGATNAAPGTPVEYSAIRSHPFFEGEACPVPSLKWLAMRAACDSIAAATKPAVAEAGAGGAGDAPPPPPSGAPFDTATLRSHVCKLPAAIVADMQQQLWLRQALHRAPVLAAFSNPGPAGGLCRVGAVPFEDREVLGLTRDLHGSYSELCTTVVAPLPAAVTPGTVEAFEACVSAALATEPVPHAMVVVAPSGASWSPSEAATMRSALYRASDALHVATTSAAATLLQVHTESVAPGVPASPYPVPHTPHAYFGLWAGGLRLFVADLSSGTGVDDTPQHAYLHNNLENVKFGSQHTVVVTEAPFLTPGDVSDTTAALGSSVMDRLAAANVVKTLGDALGSNTRCVLACCPEVDAFTSAPLPVPAVRQLVTASGGDPGSEPESGSDSDSDGDAGGDDDDQVDARPVFAWVPAFNAASPQFVVLHVGEHGVKVDALPAK